MKPLVLALLGVALANPGHAAESADHQRIGAETVTDHRWETNFATSLTPFGPADWEFILSPALSYEYQRTWSATVSFPYRWLASSYLSTVVGAVSTPAVDFSWKSHSGDPRWNVGIRWDDPSWTGMVGLSAVYDPVIVSAGLNTTVLASAVAAGGQFTFQEVVNDQMVWHLSAQPRALIPWGTRGGVPQWSLSVAWGVAWFAPKDTVSVGVSSGSGGIVSMNSSAAHTW